MAPSDLGRGLGFRDTQPGGWNSGEPAASDCSGVLGMLPGPWGRSKASGCSQAPGLLPHRLRAGQPL